MGVHNLYRNEAGRQILFSDQFVEHPRYRGTRTSLKNDVALVKLPNGGARFSGKKVFFGDALERDLITFVVNLHKHIIMERCKLGSAYEVKTVSNMTQV